ncbi:TerC family protein [Pseudidiomarina andamanensis]|uniref:TerC family protein n=1 Tax=Pseudidiomarina andamanensis TaxID=1940690 RepID=A0AA92IM49_9GAMM|nr:TerC family protein [Pseudidiomarina andamanensis]MDS0219520.1 TerC family protein [Pseudidiomarina andamanensis]QGT95849.1 TerC family protein [Pseudidiomarina andamanensis]
MFEWIMMPEAWLALLTLTLLEIVLGIDNIIFISILVGRLPEAQRQKARQVGLMLAMGMRIALLLAIVWVMGLTKPLFSILEFSFSGRDLILLGGGLFLLAKSTLEIHHSLEGSEAEKSAGKAATFGAIITQIAVIDIVFSLDSVITAVGLVEHVSVMIIAVVVAVLVMLLAAKSIGDFVDAHPTIKMLALSFLILIGFTLVGEGLGFHVPKGYVYFAMAFSLGVELLNLRVRKRREPVHLKKRIGDGH